MTVRQLEAEIKSMYPKEEGETVSNTSTAITSAAFVNSSPLMPTADLPEDKSNYGQIKIAPPTGTEEEYQPRFINYGEIKDDDEVPIGGINPDSTQSIPNIKDIKNYMDPLVSTAFILKLPI